MTGALRAGLPKCSKLPNGEVRIVRRDLDAWYRVVPGRLADGAENASPGDEPRESFDVRFRKIRSYKGTRGKTLHGALGPWLAVTHPETFKTQALADGRLAELRTYARNGVPFDVATGLPVPEVRQARAEAAKADELYWYQHALNYLARRRKGLAGNSVRSVAETLATVTPVLLVPGQRRPGRRADPGGAVLLGVQGQGRSARGDRGGPALGGGPLPAAGGPGRPDLMLDVLDAIASKLDGTARRREHGRQQAGRAQQRA